MREFRKKSCDTDTCVYILPFSVGLKIIYKAVKSNLLSVNENKIQQLWKVFHYNLTNERYLPLLSSPSPAPESKIVISCAM